MAVMGRIAILVTLLVLADAAMEVKRPCLNWTDCDKKCGGGQRTCEREGKDYSINCYMQDCELVDKCGKADVLFVLDSSGSLGPKNWWKTKQFAIDLSRGLKISFEDSRVGMVSFSNQPVVNFQLGEYNDHDSVEEAIWASPWMAASTNTREALKEIINVFNQTGRPGVKHIVVFVTDGKSNRGRDETIPTAEKVHAEGIEIFSLGIGDVDDEEVRGIASLRKDDHTFILEDFTGLTAITSQITNSTCIAANRTECGEWSEYGDECVLDDAVNNCGPGQFLRTRECSFFLYEGAEPQVRTDVEGKPCEGPPCPTTTPEPTTTTTPEATTTEGKEEPECELGALREPILFCAKLLEDLAKGK